MLAAVALSLLAVAAPNTWYVGADAPPGGDGSRRSPFDSLAAVEAASAPGDEIVVLPSPQGVHPLDGGIALKPGQRLVGAGPPVLGLDEADHARLHARLRRQHRLGHRRLRGRRQAAHRRLHARLRRLHREAHAPLNGSAPRLTNGSAARHQGDAVVLADGATVENLAIEDPHRGGIYGLDVRDVTVRGNDVSGHNTSCTTGFLIGPFRAPTSTGVNIPADILLTNGWAGIMVDESRTTGRIRIDRNHVHEAECGDGIDVRVYGTADVRADITRNRLERLEQGEGLQSILAIGLQTRDEGRLVAFQDHNTVDDIGSSDADSEGMFAELKGSSTMDVTIDHATYTNPKGIGGFSSNGMEMVATGGSPRASMVIRNSSFSGPPGDILEAGNLAHDAEMSLTLDHVVATRSVGLGNTHAIPFNNGDCLVGGNGDARNTFSLRIVDSELSHCMNNGVSVLQGAQPGGRIDVEIVRSRISHNRGINLWLGNTGGLDQLAVRVEDSALCDAGGTNVQFEERGATARGSIDLTGNDLSGGGLQARVQGYAVSARNNWWGTAGGPGAGRTLVLGTSGRLEHQPALGAAPVMRC